MAELDRFKLDKEIIDFARDINKNHKYLDFDNLSEAFIYAMSLASEMSSNEAKQSDGLFNDRDLHSREKAIITAFAYSKLQNLDDVVDKSKVYPIVEGMASTGFKMMKKNYDDNNEENLLKQLILSLNEKYKSIFPDE